MERNLALASNLELESGRFPARRWWALLAVGLGTFMTNLDNNIINVAIPTIQRDLHLSNAGIEWVVSSYILLFAGLLLAGGRLADVYGRRRLLLSGLAIFTGASLAAGASGSVGMLIASRALQGVGAALLVPATLAIITALFPAPKEQAAAVGIWSAVGALALAVGPLLGGVLSEDANWHWIFFINLPIGVLTLLLGAWAIPSLAPAKRVGVDVPGLITSSVSLFALTYALIEGTVHGWTSGIILGSLATAVVSAGLFVVAERRTPDPMIDLSLFSNSTVAGGTTGLMMWAFGLFGIYFFTSLYLQNVLGFSPIRAGMAFVPMALLMAGGATVSDRVASAVGAHRAVGSAMGLMAAGIVTVGVLGAHASFGDLMPGFALIGIGGGLTIPLTSTIIGVMPPTKAGVASAVFNASREMAGLLGITVIGVVLTSRQAGAASSGRPPVIAFLDGYKLGLYLAALLVGAGGIVAWRALRKVAAELAPGTERPSDPRKSFSNV